MRFSAAALLTTTAVALAACGGDDSSGGSDRASKDADAVLKETAAAFAKVKSYHLEGTQTDPEDGSVKISGDISNDGRIALKLDNKGATADIIVVGNLSYLRGNRAFWEQQGGASGARVARLLADKWVKSPEGATEFTRGILPKDVGYCLVKEAGTVTNTGARKVAGEEVVVLTDKGDKPGTSPGELYLPATGPALPTRLRQTGPEKAGGTPDPRCEDDDGDNTSDSDVRLSDYDKPVEIEAPKGALDLQDLQPGGTQGEESTA